MQDSETHFTARHAKYGPPVCVMVLCVVSSEGNFMSPHFFPHGARVNAVAYTYVLKTVVTKEYWCCMWQAIFFQ